MFLWRFILKFPYCFFFSGSSRTSRSSWIPWTKRPSSKCHSFSFSFFTDSVFKFCKSQLIYEIYLNTNIDTNSYKNKTCVYMPSHFSCVQLCATLWIAACQAPLPIGILQTRIFEWVAMPSSRGSSRPRTGTHVSYVSCIGKWHCTVSLPLALPGSPFDYVDHSKLWTILKEMECKNTFLACWETFMQV